MDLIDLIWDVSQERQIGELRGRLDRMQLEQDLARTDSEKPSPAPNDLLELKLRHGLLVRLLIAKGLISAEEYANLIAQTRPGASKPVES